MTYDEAVAQRGKYIGYLGNPINDNGIARELDFIIVYNKRSVDATSLMRLDATIVEKAVTDDEEFIEQLKTSDCEILFVFDLKKRTQTLLEVKEPNKLPGIFMDENAFGQALETHLAKTDIRS